MLKSSRVQYCIYLGCTVLVTLKYMEIPRDGRIANPSEVGVNIHFLQFQVLESRVESLGSRHDRRLSTNDD